MLFEVYMLHAMPEQRGASRPDRPAHDRSTARLDTGVILAVLREIHHRAMAYSAVADTAFSSRPLLMM